jgi:hypothetical protein
MDFPPSAPLSRHHHEFAPKPTSTANARDLWVSVGVHLSQQGRVRLGVALHIETSRGVASETATALRSLGYDLRSAVDPHDNTAHRFYRGISKIDLVANRPDEEPE